MTDTIAAIATALSPSAIGILRLSGPETKNVLDAVFFPLNDKPMSQQAPRTMAVSYTHLDVESAVEILHTISNWRILIYSLLWQNHQAYNRIGGIGLRSFWSEQMRCLR